MEELSVRMKSALQGALLHSLFISVRTPMQSFSWPRSANTKFTEVIKRELESIEVYSCVTVHAASSYPVSLLCTRSKWSGHTLADGRRWEICTSFSSLSLDPGVLFAGEWRKRGRIWSVHISCVKSSSSLMEEQTLWK